ncbi:MAG: PAS domain S-box protein [Pseudomonadota bacterium]
MLDGSIRAGAVPNLQDAFDGMIDGAVIIGPENQIVYFNPAAERLWGYTAAEVMNKNVKMLIPEEMRGEHDSWVNRHRRDQKDRIVGSSREVQMEHKDRRHIWVSLALSQMQDDQGRASYVALIRDISEERIKRGEIEQTLSQALDAVVSIDEHNNVTFFNAAAEALWGYSAAEVVGRNVKMLVPPEMQHKHDGFVDHHRNTGEDRIVGTSRLVPIHRRDGSVARARLSLSQIKVDGIKRYTAFVSPVADKDEVTAHTLSAMQDLLTEIGKLTKSIGTISRQTNLLSVNASIEASRAGDTGRGFAVVAGEIRSLSAKVSDTTAKINEVVESGRVSVNTLAETIVRSE